MSILRSNNREIWVAHLNDKKEDRFAKTFLAKCDMIDAWDRCTLLYDDAERLLAGLVWTVSKRNPPVANLQLLHTLSDHRGKGAAKYLVELSVRQAWERDIEYFRVSADKDAIGFYAKLGFKYIGRQKSGSQLSMFRLTSPIIQENDFTPDDYIWKQATRNGKGACVELFMEEPKTNDIDSFLN